jgi:hypothetical protein
MEKIDINRITKKELCMWLKTYAKNIGVKTFFNKNMCDNAGCVLNKKEIVLNCEVPKKNLVFAFFHEIGHCEIIKRGLFKIANETTSKNEYNKLTKKEKVIFKTTILKYEQWCDTFGEKESKKYFKNPNCYKPYFKYGKKYIKNVILYFEGHISIFEID